MAKREQTSVRFEHVQVDICPAQAGIILSVGAVSMWLPETTVREVVSKLQDGLRQSSPSLVGGAPRFDNDNDGSN